MAAAVCITEFTDPACPLLPMAKLCSDPGLTQKW